MVCSSPDHCVVQHCYSLAAQRGHFPHCCTVGAISMKAYLVYMYLLTLSCSSCSLLRLSSAAPVMYRCTASA